MTLHEATGQRPPLEWWQSFHDNVEFEEPIGQGDPELENRIACHCGSTIYEIQIPERWFRTFTIYYAEGCLRFSEGEAGFSEEFGVYEPTFTCRECYEDCDNDTIYELLLAQFNRRTR